MSAEVNHALTYVRHIPEVGEPITRRIAEQYNEPADSLRAEVFNLWTAEKRRTAQHCLRHGFLPDALG